MGHLTTNVFQCQSLTLNFPVHYLSVFTMTSNYFCHVSYINFIYNSLQYFAFLVFVLYCWKNKYFHFCSSCGKDDDGYDSDHEDDVSGATGGNLIVLNERWDDLTFILFILDIVVMLMMMLMVVIVMMMMVMIRMIMAAVFIVTTRFSSVISCY